MITSKRRLQYAQAVVEFPDGTVPEWRFLGLLGEAAGFKMIPGTLTQIGDREATRWYLGADPVVSTLGLSIAKIKDGGVQLNSTSKGSLDGTTGSVSAGAPSAA